MSGGPCTGPGRAARGRPRRRHGRIGPSCPTASAAAGTALGDEWPGPPSRCLANVGRSPLSRPSRPSSTPSTRSGG
eukprot:9491046-Pyramimonas_sp.AAC.1